MWNFFKRKDAKVVEKQCPACNGRGKVLDSIMQALAAEHKCPDCGGTLFTPGPSGGMSQNIKCSNPECGSEFCCAPMDDGVFCGEPFFADRTNRTEADSKALYGRGYGPKHFVKEEPPSDFIFSGRGGNHITD